MPLPYDVDGVPTSAEAYNGRLPAIKSRGPPFVYGTHIPAGDATCNKKKDKNTMPIPKCQGMFSTTVPAVFSATEFPSEEIGEILTISTWVFVIYRLDSATEVQLHVAFNQTSVKGTQVLVLVKDAAEGRRRWYKLK